MSKNICWFQLIWEFKVQLGQPLDFIVQANEAQTVGD